MVYKLGRRVWVPLEATIICLFRHWVLVRTVTIHYQITYIFAQKLVRFLLVFSQPVLWSRRVRLPSSAPPFVGLTLLRPSLSRY